MKDGWRYTFWGSGALCVRITSALLMPLLCAASWDTQLILTGGVRHLKGAEGSSGCNSLIALDMKLIFFSAEDMIMDITHLIVVQHMVTLE